MSTTLQELRDLLDDRISAASVSGFWDQQMKDDWINQAGRKVSAFKRWPWLELALKTYTRDSSLYYDYPTGANEFRKNSIYQIDVEGESYPIGQPGRARINWEQFEIARQAEDTRPVFSNHNGFYFLNPIPEDGKEMTIYGIKTWQDLVAADDEMIAPDDFSEAIVRTALASALRKAEAYDRARAELQEVYDPNPGGVLTDLWNQENEGGPSGYGGQARTTRFG